MKAPTSLDPIQRLQLINQYLILEKIDPREKDTYSNNRRVLEEGYTAFYGELLNTIDEEMPPEECEFVFDVLNMYRDLIGSYERLADKSGIEAVDVQFGGFDGNNESKQLRFLKYLKKIGRYSETLKAERDWNSHSETVSEYRRMLHTFSRIQAERKQSMHAMHPDRWVLTADQIKEIIGK